MQIKIGNKTLTMTRRIDKPERIAAVVQNHELIFQNLILAAEILSKSASGFDLKISEQIKELALSLN